MSSPSIKRALQAKASLMAQTGRLIQLFEARRLVVVVVVVVVVASYLTRGCKTRRDHEPVGFALIMRATFNLLIIIRYGTPVTTFDSLNLKSCVSATLD